MPENIIEISNLDNRFGKQWVHHQLNLDIKKGEILAIIGGSGSGKTTLIRSVLMLQEPTAGTIKVFGQNIRHISHNAAQRIRSRWGMLFQHSALFSALNVRENIMFPMQELTDLNLKQMKYINEEWIEEFTTPYQTYLDILKPKEQEKKLKKERHNTFLIFHSGKAIMSGINSEFQRRSYYEFLDIIRKCYSIIKENLYDSNSNYQKSHT